MIRLKQILTELSNDELSTLLRKIQNNEFRFFDQGDNGRVYEIDGEDNPDLADKYKVEGYPTIKLIKGNQVIEYDAKPTKEHLKEFLNSTLL